MHNGKSTSSVKILFLFPRNKVRNKDDNLEKAATKVKKANEPNSLSEEPEKKEMPFTQEALEAEKQQLEKDLKILENEYKKSSGTNKKKIKKKMFWKKVKEETVKAENSVLTFIKKAYNNPDRNRIIDRCIRLIKDLFNILHTKKFEVNASIGTDNPATTATILGFVYMVSGISGYPFIVSGNFQEKEFETHLELCGYFFTIALLYILIKFFLSRPIWNLLMNKRKPKKGDDSVVGRI